MPAGARFAALIAALLACLAVAGPAAAAERPPRLVAQIAQATPEPAPGGQPELSEEPPNELSGSSPQPAPGSGNGTGGRRPAAATPPLAETGSDAAMLALAGFSLLGWGIALRLRLRDAA
jgi:hypothetical protein